MQLTEKEFDINDINKYWDNENGVPIENDTYTEVRVVVYPKSGKTETIINEVTIKKKD